LFAYDEQDQASIAYDEGSLSVFNYDSATLRVADEKEIQTAGTGVTGSARRAEKLDLYGREDARGLLVGSAGRSAQEASISTLD